MPRTGFLLKWHAQNITYTKCLEILVEMCVIARTHAGTCTKCLTHTENYTKPTSDMFFLHVNPLWSILERIKIGSLLLTIFVIVIIYTFATFTILLKIS